MEYSKYLSLFATFCYAGAVYLIGTDRWLLAMIAMALGTCLIATSTQQKEDQGDEA